MSPNSMAETAKSGNAPSATKNARTVVLLVAFRFRRYPNANVPSLSLIHISLVLHVCYFVVLLVCSLAYRRIEPHLRRAGVIGGLSALTAASLVPRCV